MPDTFVLGWVVLSGTACTVLAQTVGPSPDSWIDRAINGGAVSILGAAFIIVLWKVIPALGKTISDIQTAATTQNEVSLKDSRDSHREDRTENSRVFGEMLNRVCEGYEKNQEALYAKIEQLTAKIGDLQIHCAQELAGRRGGLA